MKYERPDLSLPFLNCPKTIDAAIKSSFRQTISEPDLAKGISNAIRSSHEQIGNTADWLPSAQSLQSAEIVLLSHQPNYMPYFGATAQFAFLDAIERSFRSVNRETVPLHIVIDTDVASDNRFRSTVFPQPSCRNGILHLPIIPSRSASPNTLMKDCNLPELSRVKAHLAKMRQALRELHPRMSNQWKHVASRFSLFEEQVLYAWNIADSASCFNTIVLSHWIHKQWGLKIPFVFASKLYPLMRNGLEAILRPLLESRTPLHSLFWRICICGARTPLSTEETTRCPSCGAEQRRTDSSSEILEGFGVNFLPRIELDNILDCAILRKTMGIMYPGGVAHVSRSNALLMQMKLPIPPTLFWRACGVSMSELQISLFRPEQKEQIRSLISNGRLSHAYHTASSEPALILHSLQLALDANLEYNSQIITIPN